MRAPSTPGWCSSARSSQLAAHWSAMALQMGRKGGEGGMEKGEEDERWVFGVSSLIQYKHSSPRSFFLFSQGCQKCLYSPASPVFRQSWTVQGNGQGRHTLNSARTQWWAQSLLRNKTCQSRRLHRTTLSTFLCLNVCVCVCVASTKCLVLYTGDRQ